MKYKIGDKVKVRNDLVMEGIYFNENGLTKDSVVEDMLKFKGKTCTINEYVNGKYILKEDCNRWKWTDEMFEELVKFNKNEKASEIDVVKVEHSLNNRTTTVYFSDDTSKTAICCPEDTFDLGTGIMVACAKKFGVNKEVADKLAKESTCVDPIFKVGDYITGTKNPPYYKITNHNTVCLVVSKEEALNNKAGKSMRQLSNPIYVKVIVTKDKSKLEYIGKYFEVNPKYFELY